MDNNSKLYKRKMCWVMIYLLINLINNLLIKVLLRFLNLSMILIILDKDRLIMILYSLQAL